MLERRPLLLLLGALIVAAGCSITPQSAPPAATRLVPVGKGWARSSVNAVIFRSHSLVTHGDTQYVAWYDGEGRMVLARRRLSSKRWDVNPSRYTGNVRDAHNAISIALDGRGVLHVAWDHHGQPLNYARGVRPGSLELTERLPMTGDRERQVTYPQFTYLPDGGLLLMYREGGSGQGDVLLNRYDLATETWRVVAHPLIDGQGERNAYPNPLVVDKRGGWHLSWTWRETPDVATNHDIMYAFSPDQGRSWLSSSGRRYRLPIVAADAEVVWEVPQGSGLINQTSMAVDSEGRPMIATYWRPAGSTVPQYELVWFTGAGWRASEAGHRTQPFRLEGEGTRRIPISRPLLLIGDGDTVYVVFRDEERGSGITVACAGDPQRSSWHFTQLAAPAVGLWEPTHDPVVWARDRRLHLFHQLVGQGEAETLEALPPGPVSVLEWSPRCRP